MTIWLWYIPGLIAAATLPHVGYWLWLRRRP